MAVPKKDISPEELGRRTSILRRFRELLKAQRDRFQAYLDALDNQKNTIESGTADDLIRHVDLEEKIVADILSIQKVIDPMEELYLSMQIGGPAKTSTRETEEVISIKKSLEGLKKEAAARVERNKNLLSKRMTELRSEIKTLRSNPYNKRTVYSGTPAPSVLDIRG